MEEYWTYRIDSDRIERRLTKYRDSPRGNQDARSDKDLRPLIVNLLIREEGMLPSGDSHVY